MAPIAGRCHNCAKAHAACIYTREAARCRRCAGLDKSNGNVLDLLARFTQQAEQHVPPTAPTPPINISEPKWQLLAEGHHVLLIGVDVGTKYSAVCWQIVEKNQELDPNFWFDTRRVIDSSANWRLPTHMAIVAENGSPRLLFTEQEIKDHLGDGIQQRDIFRLLKLETVPDDFESDAKTRAFIDQAKIHNANALRSYQESGLLSVSTQTSDIFQEYLSYLWKTIRENLMRVSPLCAEDLERVFKDSTRIVVAAPAIWTASMNSKFRKLLHAAGFPNVSIRSESKVAAAVFAHQQQRDAGPSKSEQEREATMAKLRSVAYLIVDIGGGTTDLNCVQIQQIWDVLRFRTLMKGAGSMSGSEYLNHLFRNMLRNILGDDIAAIADDVDLSIDELLDSFTLGFETAKKNFSRDTATPLKVPLESVTGDPKRVSRSFYRVPNLVRSHIKIDVDQADELFQKYVAEIMRLIDQQLNAMYVAQPPGIDKAAILLAGGGSLIPYVRETITAHYKAQGIEVTHFDDNDFSTVAKGAVLAAVDPNIGIREYSRTTYGTLLSVRYDATNSRHVADFADPERVRRTPGYLDDGYELCHRFHAVLKYGEQLPQFPKPFEVAFEHFIEFEKSDANWPLELPQEVYEVTDSYWRMQDDCVPEGGNRLARKLNFNLKVCIPRNQCCFPLYVANDIEYYSVWYRTELRRDGICEQWRFSIHPSGKKIETQNDLDEAIFVECELDEVVAHDFMELDD